MTRTWSTTVIYPNTIRLMCNGVHLASVNFNDDCGGRGWKVNPMSPNHARSRRYWPTPDSAVRSTYGKAAAIAMAEAFEHVKAAHEFEAVLS